jgi:hypothetical protein
VCCRNPALAAARLLAPVGLAALAALVSVLGGAAADQPGAAPEIGGIVPMERVVERARAHRAGRLLAIELEPSEGQGDWVYEVKILTAAGAVVKLVYDAHTAELLSEKTPAHVDEDETQD